MLDNNNRPKYNFCFFLNWHQLRSAVKIKHKFSFYLMAISDSFSLLDLSLKVNFDAYCCGNANQRLIK